MTLGARFDTGCLVFDEGNAASTTDGLQVKLRAAQARYGLCGVDEHSSRQDLARDATCRNAGRI